KFFLKFFFTIPIILLRKHSCILRINSNSDYRLRKIFLKKMMGVGNVMRMGGEVYRGLNRTGVRVSGLSGLSELSGLSGLSGFLIWWILIWCARRQIVRLY